MVIILNRQRLQLGMPLQQGGAGAFYAHPSDPGVGIKIYLKREDCEAPRIEWLCANRPPDLIEQGIPTHAWPRDVAYDEATGEAAGFSMDHVRDAPPLQSVVDPGSRPAGISQAWLWKVAISLVRRIQLLQLLSPPHLAGDINFQNFLVHRLGIVTQIDIDSTHFSLRSGTTFACDRCRPELQPPELVSPPSGVLERFEHQVAFSTFIVVHRLIRDGLHPFRAHYVGSGKPLTLEEVMQKGIWPDSLLHQDYRPIPGISPFTALPASIQSLFQRMFQEGAFEFSKRPNVSELLTELQQHQPAGTKRAAVSQRDWKRILNPRTVAPGVTRPHGHPVAAVQNLRGTPQVVKAKGNGSPVGVVLAVGAVAMLGIATVLPGDSTGEPRREGSSFVTNRAVQTQPESQNRSPSPLDDSAKRIARLFTSPPPTAQPAPMAPSSNGGLKAPALEPSIDRSTPSLWQGVEEQLQ